MGLPGNAGSKDRGRSASVDHAAQARVPEDVSVVGFDGLPLGEYTSPPLTTVAQDFHRAGTEMVRLVLEQAHGRPLEESHVIIPTHLIIRGSTAAPLTGTH